MKLPAPAFEPGTIVYLRVNPTEMKGMVTGFTWRPGILFYLVTWGDDAEEEAHQLFEITDEITYDTSLSGGGSETSP